MRECARGKALAAAHRSGVVHLGDLKPTNIFLHKDRDGRVVPKILDFGVSKILEEDRNTALTVVGTVLGSPLYMSPEQAMGAEGIDGRTDVFAFGSILFESLTAQRAFDAPNFNALIVTIATTQPKRIDDAAPWLPDPLRALIRDCLVTDKNKRLDSFDRIVERLDLMMPELGKSEEHIRSATPSDTPSDPESTAEVRVIRASERPPPPTTGSGGHGSVVAVHMSNRPPPPGADETIPARRWLEKTQESLFWLPKRLPRGPAGVAIGVGGLLAVVGVVIGVAAAFSGSGGDGEPAAAAAARAQGATMTVTSITTSPVAPPATACSHPGGCAVRGRACGSPAAADHPAPAPAAARAIPTQFPSSRSTTSRRPFSRRGAGAGQGQRTPLARFEHRLPGHRRRGVPWDDAAHEHRPGRRRSSRRLRVARR